MAMDVTQLKTLIHIAELGSVSKAADRLNIAQPALSRQIRLLEQELGASLFERHGHGMVITDIGREVLDHATRILAEMEAIRDTALNGQTSYRGKISIGTTPTVAEIVTVPLVTTLRQAHPHLSIRMSSAYSGHIIDWLQRGQIDIAVSYNPQRAHTLRIVPIMNESLLFVSAKKKRLTLDSAVPFSQLAGEELVLPSIGHMLRDVVDGFARQAGVKLQPSVEADSFRMLISLVRAGIGSTILPLAPIYPMVESGDLSAAPLVDPAPTRKLVVAYPSDRPISLAAKFVGETIIGIAKDLAKRSIWVGHLLEQVADRPSSD